MNTSSMIQNNYQLCNKDRQDRLTLKTQNWLFSSTGTGSKNDVRI